MQKIRNLEILRIIGFIAVLLLHLFTSRLCKVFPDIEIYNTLGEIFSNGNKAVDLFFILSGFFFALKLNINQSLWHFVKKKLIRFYPVMIFVMICFSFMSLLGFIKFKIYEPIINLLFLNGTPLVMRIGTPGIFWYLSALMWSLVFYFYLLKNYEKKNVNLIIAMIIFLGYGIIIHSLDGEIHSHSRYIESFINIGMLRGLCGVGLGYFIAEWYNSNIEIIKNFTCNIFQKILFTAAEGYCLFFIIYNLLMHKLKYNNQMIFIIFFVFAIVLLLLKKGYISKFLDNDICTKLSKYTFSLYMSHTFIIDSLKGSLWKTHPEIILAHPIINAGGCILLVLIFGIFTYHFIEKPCNEYFKRIKK